MLNQAKEELNKLIQRLEMIFQIQTHEVVQDLKKIRELLNTQEDVEAPKQNKEKVKEESKQEVVEEIAVKQPEETQQPTPEVKTQESKEELVKRYIEKFQKKPFAWRSVEVLKEKMWE